MSAAVETFNAADGDLWWQRNREALETAVERDWALRLIARNALEPGTICEFGSAHGWRLAALYKPGRRCYGIDISPTAILEGQKRWPFLILRQGDIAEMSPPEPISLAIASFVMHWQSRDRLSQAIANIDSALKPGGHLILQDFDPPEPVDVPYHHREGVWTYKRQYDERFTSLGTYQEIDRIVYNHDTGQLGDAPSDQRAACVLLKKSLAGLND